MSPGDQFRVSLDSQALQARRNASKYGALSDPNGNVSITWSIAYDPDCARLKFRWQEGDGPAVKPTCDKGFGSSLLESALPADLAKPRLGYDPNGFVYEIETPLGAVQGR